MSFIPNSTPLLRQLNLLVSMQYNPILSRLYLPLKDPGVFLMISGTIQTSPIKLSTVTVPLTAYQNRNINLAYDITMTSLLKQWEKVNFLETKQMIYRSKGDDDSFP